MFAGDSGVAGQQAFPVTSTVNESSIAGRPVELDSQSKLLPWPMPNSTGYSYSGCRQPQWTIVWDQYNRQRLPYYFLLFLDFDRTTFELMPDWHWVNSTGYLRAMMQGFVERLYPYTGDPRTVEFLENFVDDELKNGLTPEGYACSGCRTLRRMRGAGATRAERARRRTTWSRTWSGKMAMAICDSMR